MLELRRLCSAVLPPTVKRVDLQHFLGKRHEIALITKRFQRKCVRETEAETAVGGPWVLQVQNRRIAADGSLVLSIGATRRVSRDHPRRWVGSQQLGGVR